MRPDRLFGMKVAYDLPTQSPSPVKTNQLISKAVRGLANIRHALSCELFTIYQSHCNGKTAGPSAFDACSHNP